MELVLDAELEGIEERRQLAVAAMEEGAHPSSVEWIRISLETDIPAMLAEIVALRGQT